MIYKVIFIPKDKIICTFDSSNYTKEEVKKKLDSLYKLYPASKSYCILSEKKLD